MNREWKWKLKIRMGHGKRWFTSYVKAINPTLELGASTSNAPHASPPSEGVNIPTSHQLELGGQGAARDFLHVESIYLQLDSGGSGGLVKWGGSWNDIGLDYIAC